MHAFDTLCHMAFWACGAALIYIYGGFPAVLFLRSRLRRPGPLRTLSDASLPSVSFIVAAHNEEQVIEKKIANCLALDYPPEKLTFTFVSDSTDRTNEILLRHAGSRIQVHILPQRTSKTAAVRSIIPACTGEILVLSDANTYYRPEALRKLLRYFQDPTVGVVTGDVRILPSQEKFGTGEGLYYRYERALQVWESRYWSTVAIDGAMYALRRGYYIPPPDTGVNDDLAIGMNVALQGLRILYAPEAIADEDPTPSDELEFRRKVRIVALGIQAFLHDQGVPSPKQWRLFWIYVSHKLLRWLAPVFLLGALAAALASAIHGGAWWLAASAAQVLFYAMAWIAWRFPAASHPVLRVAYYFSMVNLAALFGLARGLRQRQSAVWLRTERQKSPT